MAGKLVIGVSIVAGLVGLYWLLAQGGTLDILTEHAAFREWVEGLGPLGPLAIVVTMTVAIVLSPIPSAPIALASGAAYGHIWGTIYVLVGAELGALVAFLLARLLGYELLHRWLGDRLSMGILGSQNTLMAIIFVSRLLPFVSFDLISYAAGLTTMSFWRFAVATLAGIIPASFLLAHFGNELASAEASRIAITVFLLGGITLIPLAVGLLKGRKRRCDGKNSDET